MTPAAEPPPGRRRAAPRARPCAPSAARWRRSCCWRSTCGRWSAGLPPLLDDIRDDLGLSGLAGGLLTALPVLGFGAFAPLAPRLSRRVSVERLLVACALLTAVAAALRGAGGVAPLFAGCALAGFAVAIAQALLPVYIREPPTPRRREC